MATPPDPASVVADADVLAADLLVGGPAREALDVVRSHSWIDLVASDPLLDDGEAVIQTLADADLAAEWRERVEAERRSVGHPSGDHPGLASALHGDAAHLLSFDSNLTSAAAGVELQGRVLVSVRTPEAFLAVFDAESLYESLDERDYPGPDRDPRS
jgi:hypothetical protein